MTPLLGDAWARQSDCSSASNGVAAARKRRAEYTDRILRYVVALQYLLMFMDSLKAVAGNVNWDMA